MVSGSTAIPWVPLELQAIPSCHVTILDQSQISVSATELISIDLCFSEAWQPQHRLDNPYSVDRIYSTADLNSSNFTLTMRIFQYI